MVILLIRKKLQAEYIELSGYEHFLDRQGVTELPILYDQLLKMVKE